MPDRIFSGMQPTGALHLGNYLGALKNWVGLQEKYESIFCIVDYHALTIDAKPTELKKRILDLALDWAAAGLDPERSTIFIQSHVPEHTELAWIFNTITPLGELSRMTQFKEKSEQHKKNVNAGLFTYPILQAADILLYKANLVPVGEDQVQHVELTRDIARAANKRWGQVFPEAKPLITRQARVMSLADPDKKMSKSLGEKHYIALTDSPDTIKKKVRSAVTTPKGVENLLGLLVALDQAELARELEKKDKKRALQYKDLKDITANAIIGHLTPIQERRRGHAGNGEKLADNLIQGGRAAKAMAEETMAEVREKVGVR